MGNRKTVRTLIGFTASAGLVAAVAAGIAGLNSASASTENVQQASAEHVQKQPPKGARAVVEVSPNPTAKRGEEVTITGNCGGGTGLKQVIGNSPENPALENIRILKSDPNGFLAKANVAQHIGNGVGPVLVDCGGEAGVTLLVTH
ncbi:hypothetical protein ACFWY9_01690 [Amycolatopsis sp. NPDC059027]|uniref:hypothetical protein n=1 Tax=unclassified Amycolatopsis TaxID=2618356 RepID=UPI003671BFA9